MKDEIIESMKECILLLLEERKNERVHLEEELLKVKDELHTAKVDLIYQKATLNHVKRKHPDLFTWEGESSAGGEKRG